VGYLTSRSILELEELPGLSS